MARECSSNARERVAVSFTIIYYINAHLPHAREFSAYARECITRKLSVASGPDSMDLDYMLDKTTFSYRWLLKGSDITSGDVMGHDHD